MKAMEILERITGGIDAGELDVKHIDHKEEYAYIMSEDKGLIRIIFAYRDYVNANRLMSSYANSKTEEDLKQYMVGVDELRSVANDLRKELAHVEQLIETLA